MQQLNAAPLATQNLVERSGTVTISKDHKLYTSLVYLILSLVVTGLCQELGERWPVKGVLHRELKKWGSVRTKAVVNGWLQIRAFNWNGFWNSSKHLLMQHSVKFCNTFINGEASPKVIKQIRLKAIAAFTLYPTDRQSSNWRVTELHPLDFYPIYWTFNPFCHMYTYISRKPSKVLFSIFRQGDFHFSSLRETKNKT